MNKYTRRQPVRGDTWRHCKGHLYVIDRITRDTEGERPHRVVYFDPLNSNAEYHDRLLSMFMDRHDSGVWRFEYEKAALPDTESKPITDPVLFTSDEKKQIETILQDDSPLPGPFKRMVRALKLWPTQVAEEQIYATGGVIGPNEKALFGLQPNEQTVRASEPFFTIEPLSRDSAKGATQKL